MNPETLRTECKDWKGEQRHEPGCSSQTWTAGKCNCIFGKVNAAADAWEFTLDDMAGMVRQLEADREQLREYGDEIVSLRTRLEAAENDFNVMRNHLHERLEAAEKAVVVLYDDVSDHLPDDILATVTACRAARAGEK